MVQFLHILLCCLLLWIVHQKTMFVCNDNAPPLILLIFKLTQNNGFSNTVRLHRGQGHHYLSAKMVSTWIESKMASLGEPTERRGIYGLPSWMASSGSGRQEILPWLYLVCVCVLSGPHSSIISYDIKHPAQWSNSHSKAPDTTYCKSIHLADELELFMWHVCVSVACDSF